MELYGGNEIGQALAVVQDRIHVAKLAVSAAYHELPEHRPVAESDPNLVAYQTAQGQLHELRQARNYIRSKPGINRRGQPLPPHMEELQKGLVYES